MQPMVDGQTNETTRWLVPEQSKDTAGHVGRRQKWEASNNRWSRTHAVYEVNKPVKLQNWH